MKIARCHCGVITLDHVKLFTGGKYNCAESVLAGVTDSLDHVSCASGFGGGIGQSGETCGAVTGAIMAMGVCLGVRNPGGTAYPDFGRLVARFLFEFEQEFKSTICRQLLDSQRVTDEAEQRAHHDARERESGCTEYVDFAARLARAIIDGARR